MPQTDADGAPEALLGVFEFGAWDAEVGDAESAEEPGGKEVDMSWIGSDVKGPAAVEDAEAEALEVAALGVDLRGDGRVFGRECFEFAGGGLEDYGDDDEVKNHNGSKEERDVGGRH